MAQILLNMFLAILNDSFGQLKVAMSVFPLATDEAAHFGDISR